MPSTPPKSDGEEHLVELRVEPQDVEAPGGVKMAPATITPDEAPIDCVMTFCPSMLRRPVMLPAPTAMMAIGMAASNTLAHLEAEECGGGREDDGHHEAHRHRIGGHLPRGRCRRHDGGVLFTGREFPVGGFPAARPVGFPVSSVVI